MIRRLWEWLVTPWRARNDWKYGLPIAPKDPTAVEQEQRQRAVGVAGQRLTDLYSSLPDADHNEPDAAAAEGEVPTPKHAKAEEGR